MTLKVGVLGMGAVGTYYGWLLHQAGCQMTTIHRSDYNHVKNHGIRLDTQGETFHWTPHELLCSGEVLAEPLDFLLICTKAIGNELLIDEIRSLISDQTAILIIQNGLDGERPFMEAFPHHQVISAIAFVCAHRSGPGHIIHEDYGGLVIGNMTTQRTQSLERIAQYWQQSGIRCDISDTILVDRWKKLLWNATFNPISVLTGQTTAGLVNDDSMNAWIRQIMHEIQELARHDKVELTEQMIDQNISKTKAMTPYKTSMLRDFESNRPMEVEAILGHMLTRASSVKDAPQLRALYQLMMSKNQLMG